MAKLYRKGVKALRRHLAGEGVWRVEWQGELEGQTFSGTVMRDSAAGWRWFLVLGDRTCARGPRAGHRVSFDEACSALEASLRMEGSR